MAIYKRTPEKEEYNGSNFKTVVEFRDKYKFSKEEDEAILAAVQALFKQNKQIKNPSGNYVPAITKSNTSHNRKSSLRINPWAHSDVFNQMEINEKLTTKKAKGATR